MRWLQAGVVVFSVMAMTGCPSEFGKDGRIAKAVHEDSTELVIKRCSKAKIEEVCGNGKENTPDCKACTQ
jgi:hypothetical protein